MPDLQCKNLSFAYPGDSHAVLKSIDLTIKRGEFLLLAGPSGCGKSTLAMALAGLVPTRVPGRVKGGVLYGEKLISKLDIHETSQHIGMVFQNPDNQIIHLDVESEVAFGPENLGLDRGDILNRVQQSLEATGMAHLRRSEVYGLSGGQKQRVAIAATLAMMPDVIVLDEPTSDLDPVGTQEVLSVLRKLNRERGMTVILVEHKIDEVIRWVDRVVLMDRGEIVLDNQPRKAFERLSLWTDMGVAVPEVVQIGHAFSNIFSGSVPLTVEEVADALRGTPQAIAAQSYARTSAERSAVQSGKTPMFHWNHVDLSYGNVNVLRDIDLQVRENEWLALVGSNGSGKTSMASLAMGFQAPTGGQVLYRGERVRVGDVSAQARETAYLFQAADNMLFAPTVRAEFQFGFQHIRKRRERMRFEQTLDDLMATLGLGEFAKYNPFHLSHGQRKRLAIGALLAMSPKVMMLDEPTTGQDEGHARAFLSFLEELRRDYGLTYLMITHDMRAVAQYADRMAVLHQGEIRYNGPPDEVFADVNGLLACSIVPPPIAKLHALLADGEAQRVCLTPGEFVKVAQCQEVTV